MVQSLVEASAALDELWAQIPPEAWDGTTVCEPEDNPDIGPITLLQLAILRLTEVEVHGTDLDLGLSDWSDPFIDAALPMRIAWLPQRHTPSQAPSGSWNLVATDGPSFNVAVSQGVVSASPGKAHQAEGITVAFMRQQIASAFIPSSKQQAGRLAPVLVANNDPAARQSLIVLI